MNEEKKKKQPKKKEKKEGWWLSDDDNFDDDTGKGVKESIVFHDSDSDCDSVAIGMMGLNSLHSTAHRAAQVPNLGDFDPPDPNCNTWDYEFDASTPLSPNPEIEGHNSQAFIPMASSIHLASHHNFASNFSVPPEHDKYDRVNETESVPSIGVKIDSIESEIVCNSVLGVVPDPPSPATSDRMVTVQSYIVIDEECNRKESVSASLRDKKLTLRKTAIAPSKKISPVLKKSKTRGKESSVVTVIWGEKGYKHVPLRHDKTDKDSMITLP